jgi:hypothetical protein
VKQRRNVRRGKSLPTRYDLDRHMERGALSGEAHRVRAQGKRAPGKAWVCTDRNRWQRLVVPGYGSQMDSDSHYQRQLQSQLMEIYNTYDDRSPGDKMVDFGIGFICFVILAAIAIVLVSGLICLLT